MAYGTVNIPGITQEELDAVKKTAEEKAEKTHKHTVSDITDFPETDVNIPDFSGSTPGLVPQSGGESNKYLRADGTWAEPEDKTPQWTLKEISGANPNIELSPYTRIQAFGISGNVTISCDSWEQSKELGGCYGFLSFSETPTNIEPVGMMMSGDDILSAQAGELWEFSAAPIAKGSEILTIWKNWGMV